MTNFSNCSGRCRLFLALTCAVIIAGCASYDERVKSNAVPEFRPGLLVGYLQPETLPNSLALLPPHAGSPRYRRGAPRSHIG